MKQGVGCAFTGGRVVPSPEEKVRQKKGNNQSPQIEENLADEALPTQSDLVRSSTSPPSARPTRYAPRASFAAQVEAWQREEKKKKERGEFEAPENHRDDSSDSSEDFSSDDFDDTSSSATLDIFGAIFCTSARYGQGQTYDEIMHNTKPMHTTKADFHDARRETQNVSTITKSPSWRSVQNEPPISDGLHEYDDIDQVDLTCEIDSTQLGHTDIGEALSPYAATIIPSQHVTRLIQPRPRLSRRGPSSNSGKENLTGSRTKSFAPQPRLSPRATFSGTLHRKYSPPAIPAGDTKRDYRLENNDVLPRSFSNKTTSISAVV